MQEELERKSISVTVQATKLTGRVMRAAIAATLRKIEKERNTPKVGRNSMPFLEHWYAAAKISWVPAYDAAA